MSRRSLSLGVIVLAAIVGVSSAWAQAGRTTTKKAPARKAAPVVKPIQVQPEVTCPAVLGVGIATKRQFCDVMVGRDPQTGIVIRIPPHRGDANLSFDLHNREMYSEQLVRENRAYTRHTATIGVLALDGTLLTRAVVDTEFRSARDLLDRVGGGAGPGGVKAVAPIGDEPIRVAIPEEVDAVSVLGEKLLSLTADGPPETFTAPGRPIAIISNVIVEYRPAPARKPTPKKPIKK
jgi:hypothetical protein